MKREIKFSLVFRDMWQSAGKYVPTVDQLTRVAPAIIEMGCFARVETNGGGFEQVNLLFGENPNKAVREWTKPCHAACIQTHMLDRALNGLRMILICIIYTFSILITFPCPRVTALIADTMAAVSCPERLPIAVVCVGVAVCTRTAAATGFFAMISSGVYLFTKTISPFPRLITIKMIANTVVIPTTINKIEKV